MKEERPGICTDTTVQFTAESWPWKTHIGDVKPKGFASNGLENKINMRLLHEAHINQLDVRERSHEFHANLHLSLERDVLKDHGNSSRQALADTDLEHNLWIGL